ncbi:fasciclin-3 isoform X3 [Cephus cinctus]|uniref:Fasciclin-3 isoform X3 n=1 Tax=Cephus cinctus TaxID=211228 RepID=A0AAJ7VXG1_CEPCN|nr:fasciclin-3 isoform X3 [Cephus cinctus]
MPRAYFTRIVRYITRTLEQNMVVEIDPKTQTVVRLGDSLRILCRVAVPIEVCRVQIPGGSAMYLKPGQPPIDGVIQYSGSGMEAGECGVLIDRVKANNDGIFKCSLKPKDDQKESSATLKIVVAKPPQRPELLVSQASDHGRYRHNDKLLISCSARSGRPAANVSLYLDDELISHGERPTIYDSNVDDNSLAVQNISRTIHWTDNGKFLRCLASHVALNEPMETKLQLEVVYPPQPQPQGTIERFGYVVGQEGFVNVTVNANPRPTFIWRVNDEIIKEGETDEHNRLQSSTAIEMGKGTWVVKLKIISIQKSDTEKEYILEARNDEGAYEYRVMLSTSAEPAESMSNGNPSPHAHAGVFSHFYGKLSEQMHALGVNLDAGSIIGIVVGVLVLILIVFLLIFARATGRWCFADGSSTRNIGESDLADPAASVSLLRFHKSKTDETNGRRSDTESAGRYSRSEVDGAVPARRRRPKITLSQLFKRNKDKVSGADSDTVRTVVTVDDEKLQTTEQPAETNVSNPASGEGGIVYAELDLTQQQVTPRLINEDKTEYAEILYTKPPTDK